MVTLVGRARMDDYRQALRLGAAGVVERAGVADRLVNVLRAAFRGETLLPAAVSRTLSETQPAAPPAWLTFEDLRLLRLLAGGASLADIGVELCLSERSVSRRVRALLIRMRARDRAAAIAQAARWGLVGSLAPGDGVSHPTDGFTIGDPLVRTYGLLRRSRPSQAGSLLDKRAPRWERRRHVAALETERVDPRAGQAARTTAPWHDRGGFVWGTTSVRHSCQRRVAPGRAMALTVVLVALVLAGGCSRGSAEPVPAEELPVGDALSSQVEARGGAEHA